MTKSQFETLIERAAELSTMTLNELRMTSPDAEGDSTTEGIAAARSKERHGADTKEIRQTHVKEILEDEFAELIVREEA
jgi:hypothetical protein